MGIGSGQDLLNLLAVAGIIIVILVVGVFVRVGVQQWLNGGPDSSTGHGSTEPAAPADPPVDHPQD